MNILVMGLESRTDFQGRCRSSGRDDLVTYPKAYYDGIITEKIDQAYYFAYVTSLNSTYGEHGRPGRPHPDVNVVAVAVGVRLVGGSGRQRGGGGRGDGRRQRQVRNTLRVLTATVCSQRREERRCSRRVSGG